MAETSHEIRRQIAATRRRLGTSIAALEHKVDPKRVVDDYPLTLVAVAFGTGVLLSTTGATGKAVHEVREQVRGGASRLNDKAGNALDGVLNAIVGAAAAAITSKLSEAVDVALRGSRDDASRASNRPRAA
ncbi:MAG: DUF3618 domain-containing protein [Gemmatimonadota bacterium]|nr:DUF3618 domain-containing protein [Gemmatimonadota bacterium]